MSFFVSQTTMFQPLGTVKTKEHPRIPNMQIQHFFLEKLDQLYFFIKIIGDLFF